MIFVNIKTKTIVFILSILTVILLIASIVICGIISPKSVNISKNEASVPYRQNHFYYCATVDDIHFIFNFDFENNTTKIYNCNTKNLVDSINKIENGNTIKFGEFSLNDIAHAIDILGGISVLNVEGNEVFVLGEDFLELYKTENLQYLSYLFGTFIKNVFENEYYDFLYKHSEISYIDICNYNQNFLKALQQLDCIEINIKGG